MFRTVKVTARTAAALAGAIVCAILAASMRDGGTWLGFLAVFAAVVAALKPLIAILVVAAGVPIVTTAMILGLQRPGVWSEALVASVLAGWLLRLAVRRDAAAQPSVLAAAAVFGSITLVSVIVGLAEWRARFSPEAFWPALAAAVDQYTTDRGGMAALIRSAARLLEGIGLCLMTAAVCGGPAQRRRVLRMIAVGAAAAAAFNINRILPAAVRSESPWTTLLSLAQTVRVSLPYADVNAAGSYFAMTVTITVALAATSRGFWPARVAWGIVVFLTGAGLWLSGSRTAILAMMVVAGAIVVLRVRRAAIVAAVLLASALVVWIFPNPILDRSAIGAMGIRAELARVAWRLTATAPVFGIGVGRFYEQSGQYIEDPYVRRLYPNENAHNNFLQILAELGVAGIAAFLWLLAEIFLAAHGRVKTEDPIDEAGPPRSEPRGISPIVATNPPSDWFMPPNQANGSGRRADWFMMFAVRAAVATFLLTCLGGHPLLIEEVAFTFWCLLGVMLAPAAARSPGVTRSAAVRTRLGAVAVALMLALTPWRLSTAAETADLEHVGYGVSSWMREPDGTRYRRTTGDATLFIQANARAVDIPLRLEPGGPPITVEIIFRNRVADRVLVATSAWQVYRLIVPPRRGDARYIPVRLRVVDGDPDALAIGRTIPR